MRRSEIGKRELKLRAIERREPEVFQAEKREAPMLDRVICRRRLGTEQKRPINVIRIKMAASRLHHLQVGNQLDKKVRPWDKGSGQDKGDAKVQLSIDLGGSKHRAARLGVRGRLRQPEPKIKCLASFQPGSVGWLIGGQLTTGRAGWAACPSAPYAAAFTGGLGAVTSTD